MSKKQGTVKWFSNKKGYGFITPEGADESNAEDIFVHQSSIKSDGYRTLGEGWVVEFDVVKDESDGKIKAENVTAPGGGPCTGPRKKRFSKGPRNENGHEDGGGGSGSFRSRAPKPQWHDVLTTDVKDSLTNKSIRHTTGTIDVSHGSERIKLGTQGYTSMAHADAILAEGSFTCDENGLVTFTWERALKFDNSDWSPHDVKELVQTITLTNDDVGQVEQDETAETLWGDAPIDPRDAFERNGFQMRRVVLTPRRTSHRYSK